jgi:hypothetical protein
MTAGVDGMERLLVEIRDSVRLIAAAMAEPLRKRLANEFLTSNSRTRMYREMNGVQAYTDIAKKAGVTGEAVRIFAVSLQAQGLVVLEKRDGRICPRSVL